MLYKLNETKNKECYQKVRRVTLAEIGWKEKDLEKLIANNIEDFLSSNDLMTIFTERSRMEEPDIMAIDAQGDLYIFELKRWSGKQENLLQVLRYGQLFGRSNYDDLNELYGKFQKTGRADLREDFQRYFNTSITEEEFNQKQHFLILTNGLDQETVESIIYWKKCNLNIDAIVYWIFEINGEHFIEFNTYSKLEDYLEYENNCYVLNTNKKTDPKYTQEMLTEHKAAAYYPGWREKIQKFQKGDIVFLYESGVGIIAYGYASGVLNKKECDGHPDYEYNMVLDNFVVLKEPLSAWKMKELTGHGFNFRQTLYSVSEETAKTLIKHAR